MQVLYCPDHDHITFDGVIEPIRETLDEEAPDILLDYPPRVGRGDNPLHANLDFIDELVAQARHLPVIIQAGGDQLCQRRVGVTVRHLPTADRSEEHTSELQSLR